MNIHKKPNPRWHQVLRKGKHVLLRRQHRNTASEEIAGKIKIHECWIQYDEKSNLR
jgi:hypothetical protein